MKQLSTIQLSLTFAGCFLGAGYVSGQELWQFCGQFGGFGIVGMLCAVGILCAFGILLLRLAQKTGLREMDKLVVRRELPWLRALVSLFQGVFLFGVTAIMAAGASALLHQLLGIPVWLGSLLFCGLVLLVAIRGLTGIVRSFSLLVPILVVATVAFGIAALVKFPLTGASFVPAKTGGNPLLSNWLLGMLTFSAYNAFATVGILCPLGELVPSKRTVLGGVGLGSLFLLAISSGVLLALLAHPEAAGAELPMLALATTLSPALSYVYGLLLLIAMFGTSSSSLVAVLIFLGQKFPAVETHRKTGAAVLATAAALGGLLGFGDLISVVYPIFGYLSLLILGCLLSHYLYVCKTQTSDCAQSIGGETRSFR
ncbi:MAG: hypothetical protein RR092_04095 [Oscillospiraceae bacterium]